MKIGIDVRLWDQTGIGRYIRNLIEELSRLDQKNDYVLFARGEDISEIQSRVSAKNFTLIKADIRWHSVSEQLLFPKLLQKYNLDLVHFPYFSTPIFYKRPYVVTVHDLIINHFPTGKATTLPLPLYTFKRMGYKFVLRQTIKNAKKIITPSLATKNEIVDHYAISKEKIVVTPEGVDGSISDFSPIVFKNDASYFLYVGNAYPHKNIANLVKAFELFSDRHPNFKLFLVGKKDFFYKRLQQNLNVKNIEFLGHVSDEELSKLYRQAAATYVPSLMEGFGLTSLEAMKMGSLVAVSKIPSLEEVCGGHAFYFDPTDVISIKKTMEEIIGLHDSDKKKKIMEGKKHAESFSWEKAARLTLDAYQSALRSS